MLEEYRKAKADSPIPLDDIDGIYTKPTDYLNRNSTAPDSGQWSYDQIGKDHYQLFAIAPVWAEHFDAMADRHKCEFAYRWFSSLDSSLSKPIGE